MFKIKRGKGLLCHCLAHHIIATNNTKMTPTNPRSGAVKPAIKKQREAKKPRGLWAFGKQGAYGVWTFPASAEAALAFIAPPTHPLLAAVPRPQRLALQPKATE